MESGRGWQAHGRLLRAHRFAAGTIRPQGVLWRANAATERVAPPRTGLQNGSRGAGLDKPADFDRRGLQCNRFRIVSTTMRCDAPRCLDRRARSVRQPRAASTRGQNTPADPGLANFEGCESPQGCVRGYDDLDRAHSSNPPMSFPSNAHRGARPMHRPLDWVVLSPSNRFEFCRGINAANDSPCLAS